MFRKALIELLEDNPLSIREIAEMLEEKPRDVEDALKHLLKSLRNMPYRAVIVPAKCNKCGFVFHKDKMHKPCKCPLCKETWISDPLISVERTGGKKD